MSGEAINNDQNSVRAEQEQVLNKELEIADQAIYQVFLITEFLDCFNAAAKGTVVARTGRKVVLRFSSHVLPNTDPNRSITCVPVEALTESSRRRMDDVYRAMMVLKPGLERIFPKPQRALALPLGALLHHAMVAGDLDKMNKDSLAAGEVDIVINFWKSVNALHSYGSVVKDSTTGENILRLDCDMPMSLSRQ